MIPDRPHRPSRTPIPVNVPTVARAARCREGAPRRPDVRPVVLADPRRLRRRDAAPDNAISNARMPHWRALLASSPHTMIDASELRVGLPDGPDGQLRGRPSQHRRRPRHLPGLHAHRPRDRDRRVRDQPGAERRDRRRASAAAARCTCWACSRRAACTATSGRSRRWSSSPAQAACARSSCTPSSTAATRRRGAPSTSLGFMDDVCAALPGRAHRVDVRPLLRDGPRPALGARRAGVRPARRRPRAVRGGDARRKALAAAYARGETDEFVQADGDPRWPGGAPATMRDGDVVVFMNFRADRARQITRALTDPGFAAFRAPRACPELGAYVCLTSYGDEFAQLAGRVRAADDPQQLRRVPRGPRPGAAAHRRDREVRARHLLLQRRRRSGLSRRGPHPRARRPRSRPTTRSPR